MAVFLLPAMYFCLTLLFNVIESCPPGKFSHNDTNCELSCHCYIDPKNKDSGHCRNDTGVCLEGVCQKNWYGPRCDITRCPFGTWGPGCRRYCWCWKGTACNSETGVCPSLKCHLPNWRNPSCNLSSCEPGKWGHSCMKTCQCPWQPEGENAPCRENDGSCPEDVFVVPNPWCDEENVWGESCANQHCLVEGCEVCDKYTGIYCHKCRKGYKATVPGTCEKCPPGSFGENCAHYCPAQCSESCHSVTGVCSKTLCDDGFYGLQCISACPPECPKKCNKETGDCPDSMFTTGYIFLIVFLCTVPFILLVALVMGVWIKRRRNVQKPVNIDQSLSLALDEMHSSSTINEISRGTSVDQSRTSAAMTPLSLSSPTSISLTSPAESISRFR